MATNGDILQFCGQHKRLKVREKMELLKETFTSIDSRVETKVLWSSISRLAGKRKKLSKDKKELKSLLNQTFNSPKQNQTPQSRAPWTPRKKKLAKHLEEARMANKHLKKKLGSAEEWKNNMQCVQTELETLISEYTAAVQECDKITEDTEEKMKLMNNNNGELEKYIKEIENAFTLNQKTYLTSSASSSPPQHDNPGTLQGTNKWIPGLGAGPPNTSLGSANGGTSFLARHMGRRGSGGILVEKTNTPVSQLLEGPDPQLDTGLTPAINEVDPAATTEDVVVSLPAVIPEGTSEPSEVAGNGKETKNDDAPCETDTGKHTDNVENANSGENVPNGDVRTTAEREIPIHDNWDSAAQADNQGQGDCGMDEEEDKEETSTPGLNVVIDIHVETAPEEPKESGCRIQ
uniref:Uncharacterized protein n=1 Tax=Branchiostoma floridae TaxID=7739 RepID=C3Z2A0_BRAFL|eukprot:XP_002597139.1 hypothetical protein BRAFLDRAFT_121297 [Branchiostoma floridae]